MIELLDEDRQRIGTLTERERNVLIQVGKGFTDEEIGDRLGVSHSTITLTVASIRRKLDVSNRVEAAVMACKAGML